MHLAGAFCTTLRLASSSFTLGKLRTCSLDWRKNPSAICILKVVLLLFECISLASAALRSCSKCSFAPSKLRFLALRKPCICSATSILKVVTYLVVRLSHFNFSPPFPNLRPSTFRASRGSARAKYLPCSQWGVVVP